MKWVESDSYISGIENTLDELHDPVRVAGFDLDDTLIHRPKGKNKQNSEWILLNEDIPDKISGLVDKNYIVIIFSNQGGMTMNKNFDKKGWKKSVEKLVDKLFSKTNNSYYFAIYAAKSNDLYRKPNLGMWNQMKEDLRNEFDLEKIRFSKKSFFCGDAAGRIKPSLYKKRNYPTSSKGDFSDVDRKFALNIGIEFYTPEEFFLKGAKEEPYRLTGFDPHEFLREYTKNEYHFEPRKKELIILIGPPGAGKTEFTKKYILPENYVHINQDICKTKKRCLELAEKAIRKNKSLIIDSTNPDVLSRTEYISRAKNAGYKNIRAIVLVTPIELAKHLNNVRNIYSKGQIPKINDIVYHIFKKKYVAPIKADGFDVIEYVDFAFDSEWLEDLAWKKIFLKFSE